MTLAQKQICKPVEQNRRARYESTQLHPPDFLTKAPKTYHGEKTGFSTYVAGKLGICMQKTESSSMSSHPVQVPTQSGLRTLI
jgi:hypothetical protein